MKSLKKIKIINWHYFWNETINIEPIVFLTGLNASGKSTLIDAMQVILLGDTTGRFFNKAAMDKSSRTLKGYLRGELGDMEDGGFHYLRNGRFTSYIAMEFFDDVNQTSFTFGCVFDIFEDGGEEHRYFLLEDKIPENEFIVQKLPMDYKTLHGYFSEHYSSRFKFFDSNRQYQEVLKRRFGGLKDKYFSLLKKSVSFTPITDITTFITEYVCDPQQNIQIDAMQENILQYKKLENEALVMKARVERLEEITRTYSVYQEHRNNMSLYSYIVEKASYQNDKNRLDSYMNQVERAKSRLLDIDVDIAEVEKNIAELNRRKVRLIQDKANNDTYRLTDELYERKAETSKRLAEIDSEVQRVLSNLKQYISSYIFASSSVNDALDKIDLNLLEDDKGGEIRELQASALKVLDASTKLRDVELTHLESIDSRVLQSWRDQLSLFKQQVSALAFTLGKTITSYDQKTALLRLQENDLRNGGKSYERTLTTIKRELADELSKRHNKVVNVEIYADLIDIKTPKWTNAIEGFLHNQKFNIFVDSQFYLEAYDILKVLLEKYRYYATTLVDVDRIIERNFVAEKGSLATEIITDHPGALAYSNFLIGRLMKCNTIQEARNSGNGITAECDLYRNFAFGKINPRLYTPAYIGRQVSEEQISAKRYEINRNSELVNAYRTLLRAIEDANQLELINTNEITAMITSLDHVKDVKSLQENLKIIDSELQKHDLTSLNTFQKRIDAIEEDIKGLEADRSSLFEEKGKLKTTIDSLTNEKIPSEKTQVEGRLEKLSRNYDPFFVAEKAEPMFASLVEQGKSPLEMITEYNVTFGHAQYLVNNVFSQVVKLRKEYIRDYRLSYDPDALDNLVYENELRDMQEVKLPEYEIKIHDAYNKATKQFKDDFISKLRGAIETVEEQIADLNEALSASTFGNDSYQFTVKPSQVYRAYYDMIKDDLLLQIGENDETFIQKYDDVMKNLFAQIVSTGENDRSGALAANVEKFTDYRSYLDFDLIVKDKEGNEQRLSKMIKKKSGGETQTPFYIAVLASFAQLYHVNDSGELNNSLRLIIFDEAFSKMDRGRIKESVRLLRKFGLQAILSAPSDKVADISELVDETLVVLRGRNASHVKLYAEENKLS